MTIKEIHLITFSPTHTSRQIGEAIARGVESVPVKIWDITLPDATTPDTMPTNALVIITLPVYGGHIAPIAVERLKDLKGNGTPAAVAVVYGNRAYEKALTELDAWISGAGFKVVAGGTFIGEHSYSSEQHPIAAGRPNEEDLAYAEEFGRKIRTKIEVAADIDHLYSVNTARILRPRQPFLPLLKFLRRVIKLRKSGTPLPRTPLVDEQLCTHCGLCVRNCPTEAIVKGDECNTLVERCIQCCACVKGCPAKARTYDTPFAVLLADNFKRQKENRIIL